MNRCSLANSGAHSETPAGESSPARRLWVAAAAVAAATTGLALLVYLIGAATLWLALRNTGGAPTGNVTVTGDSTPGDLFTVTFSGAAASNANLLTLTSNALTGGTSPSVGINNVTVTEVDAGSVTATFTATLSAVSGRTVTVDYATSDVTATAPADYSAASGTLTFAPGVTTRTIPIAVQGDLSDEANETYRVTLSNPTNVTIATSWPMSGPTMVATAKVAAM